MVARTTVPRVLFYTTVDPRTPSRVFYRHRATRPPGRRTSARASSSSSSSSSSSRTSGMSGIARAPTRARAPARSSSSSRDGARRRAPTRARRDRARASRVVARASAPATESYSFFNLARAEFPENWREPAVKVRYEDSALDLALMAWFTAKIGAAIDAPKPKEISYDEFIALCFLQMKGRERGRDG